MRLAGVFTLILWLISAQSFASSGQVLVHTDTGAVDLTYEITTDGLAITEGDILIHQAELDAQGSGIPGSYQTTRWPDAVMPYYIDATVPQATRDSIKTAMKHWQHHTRVRFKELSFLELFVYPDRVKFVKNDGRICASEVGRVGGEQRIVLAARCHSGNIVHEIGHALGLWHEQSRADRDDYITIVWDNIEQAKQYNFARHVKDGILLGSYDYNSIMHYGAKAFSINGEDTIIPKQAEANIGQRNHLSSGDIAAITQMYG